MYQGRLSLRLPLCIAALLATPGVGFPQDMEAKLSQRAIQIPASSGAFEQLIEIAKRFKIPMGIERVGEDGQDTSRRLGMEVGPRNEGFTVRSLIGEVLKGAPGYRATIAHGVLLIGKPGIMKADRIFLI
jgi:hypothetical protein